MPGLDGFEITRKIRKRYLYGVMVPIILITALQETEARVKGIDAGCDDFISKPVDRSEFDSPSSIPTENQGYTIN